jgi:hypothetical protein
MEHQPRPGGDLPTPEQREHLRITTVILPANEHEPLRQADLGVADVQDYQRIIDGYIEAVSLDAPSSTLYCNEEGKPASLPFNRRATMLLWAHQPALRFFDYIAGDALLVGPMDDQGDDTDVPDAFMDMFFRAKRLRVEVQTRSEPRWQANELRFAHWTDVYGYVLQLAQRWTQIEDMRVMPDD